MSGSCHAHSVLLVVKRPSVFCFCARPDNNVSIVHRFSFVTTCEVFPNSKPVLQHSMQGKVNIKGDGTMLTS
eukprot:3364953-Amphidinium_carterae.1